MTDDYKTGVKIGIKIRQLLMIGAIGVLVTQCQAPTPAKSAATIAAPVKAHIATHKPVKHRIRRHKKCGCNCIIKLDKPASPAIHSDKPDIEEIESRLTTLEERLDNGIS